MKNKLISIIIPVYNSEKGIKETIDTIILQNVQLFFVYINKKYFLLE